MSKNISRREYASCEFNPVKNRPSFLYELKKIYNPPWFQGSRARDNYFEGWYFKSVTGDGSGSLAFIPGISLSGNDNHSFVQAIDGKTGQSWYFRFPVDAFRYSGQRFEVAVGSNYFSENSMVLDLHDDVHFFKGSLNFSTLSVYPVSISRPGIMGWYRYAPFMECYHGVVSLDHRVNGSIETGNGPVNFSGGRGYIEKDWGTSMPEAWIWAQTNNFPDPGTSFMMSIAKIPWIGKSFTGFLGFFLHRGRLYDFATYTGADVKLMEEKSESILIRINAREFSLNVRAFRGEKGQLKAPVSGTMERVIHESIDSAILVELFDKRGRSVYSGQGHNAGLEIVGEVSMLFP